MEERDEESEAEEDQEGFILLKGVPQVEVNDLVGGMMFVWI